MNEEKKAPAPEVSLKYMAWDIKTIAKGLQDLNLTLQELKKTIEDKML